MKNFKSVMSGAVAAFTERCKSLGTILPPGGIEVYENPTEEIHDAFVNKKKTIRLHAGKLGAKARLEENYLFDTRRFPTFTAAEASAAGPSPSTNSFTVAQALVPQDYLFFQNAVGQPAINNGFGSVFSTMSSLETNMVAAGQVPQGRNFALIQIGISFNSDIQAYDAATLMEAGALIFSKQGGQFTYQHGPVSFWPGGMGLGGMTTATATTLAHNGISDIRAVRRLSVPRVIEAKESFAYIYSVPRATSTRSAAAAALANTLSGPCLMRVWLWGGQEDAIPV